MYRKILILLSEKLLEVQNKVVSLRLLLDIYGLQCNLADTQMAF